MEDFGKMVHHYRVNRPDPLSLNDVAVKCGVTKTAIYDIEKGAMPRLGLAVRIIKALSIPSHLVFPTEVTKDEIRRLVTVISNNNADDQKTSRMFRGTSIVIDRFHCRESAKTPNGNDIGTYYFCVLSGEVIFEFIAMDFRVKAGSVIQFPAYLSCIFWSVVEESDMIRIRLGLSED